jgi:hypothetical protein
MRTPAILLLLLAAPTVAATQNLKTKAAAARDINEVVWTDPRRGIDVRAHGEVLFTEDRNDVAQIGPAGYLILQEEQGGTVRRIEYRPGPDGGVERAYSVNGARRALDAEGRMWAADFIRRAVVQSPLGAEARVRQILACEGVPGVLAEVSRTDYFLRRAVYIQELVESHSLSPGEVRQVLRYTADLDYPSGQERILTAIVDRHPMTQELWGELLRMVGDLGSSSTQRALLRAALAASEGATVPAGLLEAADRIASTSERQKVLLEVLDQTGLSPATLIEWLQSVSRIGPSQAKADLLLAAIPKLPEDQAVRAAFIQAAETIGSDEHYNRVAMAFLRQRSGVRP